VIVLRPYFVNVGKRLVKTSGAPMAVDDPCARLSLPWPRATVDNA
jgi:hypothetical protein